MDTIYDGGNNYTAPRLLLESRSLSQDGHFVLPVDNLEGCLLDLAPILQGTATQPAPAIKTTLWLDTNHSRIAVPDVFRFYHQPLDKDYGCTCPSGEEWHTMSQKLGWGPRPVEPVAAGRTFQRNFDCRWCIKLAAYWPKRYDWLWRHVNAASVTILGHAPHANEISFSRDRRSITYTLETLHENVSTLSKEIAKEIMKGVHVDPMLAKGVLSELRATRQYIKMEMMDYYAWNSEPVPHIKRQDTGLRAIIAATECAAFDNRWLTARGCVRLPIVPTWIRNGQQWKLTGHYIVDRADASAWYNWMTPLGITELTDTP